MIISFENKVALVTGAASGLGLATAKAFAESGASVVLADWNEEEGIAAFLLGDIATAKKNVVRAWMVAKALDPGAHIRYASLYGVGLVEMHKYQEALGPLNEAINVANKTSGAAYPTIAITGKIEALSGTGQNAQALALAADELKRVNSHDLAGHLYEIYQVRAGVYQRMGQQDLAIADLSKSAQYAATLNYWRGLTQVDGLLAKAYLEKGALQPALASINAAIEANRKIPDELYFVPRDLGIKAEILARLGNTKASNELYEKSADLFDALLSKVPTPTVERQLLDDLSMVYAGYFSSLCDQGRVDDAFRAIERARGRVEAQGLAHHEIVAPHLPGTAEKELTALNVKLLDTDDSSSRAHILDSIYSTELQLGDSSSSESTPHPVGLKELQQHLGRSEVLVEYVLGEPHSYALALTRESVHRYVLETKEQLERDSAEYRSTLLHQKANTALGQHLFNELLGGIRELDGKSKLIVIPDGKLHLLPFAALVNGGHYLVSSYEVSVAPSGTVLNILRHRSGQVIRDDLSYVGVAAWVTKSQPTSLIAMIQRSVSGPVRRDLVALPESAHEVEAIATDLPKPNTVLLGDRATESNFKQLPLSRFAVIHLALHGYVDPEIPDRSALVFAPESPATNDGLLQVREIRSLPINANLVTLSACNTGVGPVGEEGVENIVNAFIEAGAESVVSTLWELQDHSTAQLMTSFYAHLAHGEEKVEALRKAQLEILNSGAPPYYWAGVELDGEPDGKLFGKVRTNTQSRSGE